MRTNARRLAIALGPLIFLAILARTAWVCDDAFITYRTVDNLVHGYGPRWNVGERVQAYTHPLWMLVVTPFYAVTREMYYTAIFLTMALTVAAVAGALRQARSLPAQFAMLAVLISSKAFIDFSTAGLENPLTHLILAGFYLLYLGEKLDWRRLFALSLLAALGVLNRMDALLFFAPPLAEALWRWRRWSGLGAVALGFAPFVLWEAFSVVYYGFPFPNTAYAKLNTGMPQSEMFAQGLYYYLNSLKLDPLTIGSIAAGLGCAAVFGGGRERAAAAGALLYLIYVVRIGGDFMSGRFFTAALFVAVILGARMLEGRARLAIGVAGAALAIGLLSPRPPLRSGAGFIKEGEEWVDERGIADERLYYYSETGLLLAPRRPMMPNFETARIGADWRKKNKREVTFPGVGIGFLGFFAGPKLHLIDGWALSDPLLARLPAIAPDSTIRDAAPTKLRDLEWRIGHFRRLIPAGYAESVYHGENRIRDPALAEYWGRLSIIVSGPIFTRERWREIWRFNTGEGGPPPMTRPR